jgi:O-antigen/teichoic acid export membrane protein
MSDFTIRLKRACSNRLQAAYGTSVLGVFSGLLSSLWFLRVFSREISTIEFGYAAFVVQIVGYLAIFQLGMDAALSRQIAESLGKGILSEARSAFQSVQRFNRYAAALCTTATGVMALGIYYFGFGFKPGHNRFMVTGLVILSGTAQVFAFLQRPYASALIGSGRLATVNLLTIQRSICATLLAFVFLKGGTGVFCMAAAEGITQACNLLLLGWQMRCHCQWHAETPSMPVPRNSTHLFHYGLLTTLGGLAWTIESTSDVIMLGAFKGASLVAIYVLWWRFPQMIFSFCILLATSAFPEFARRQGQRLADSLLLLRKLWLLTLGAAALALLGISLWLPSFVRLWLGTKYGVEEAHTLAVLMGMLVFLRTMGNLGATFLMAVNQPRLPTLLSWIQAGTKILLGVWLVRSWGIRGLMLASCLASAIQIVGTLTAICRLGVFGRKILGHSLWLSLLAISGSFLIPTPLRVHSPLLFVCAVALTAGIWALIWLQFARKSELREKVAGIAGFLFLWGRSVPSES